MAKYRKKPVVIEAVRFEWANGEGAPDIPGLMFERWTEVEVAPGLFKNAPVVETAYVQTLEGKLHVSRGDWLIWGVKGELYPCKPDIFEATYEPAEASHD